MGITRRVQPTSTLNESSIFIAEDTIPATITYDLGSNLGGSSVVDLYFVDGSGAAVTPTGGTVVVSGSVSEAPWPFRRLSDGSFSAASTVLETFSLPNSYGGILRLKFDFTGVTGAEGFRAAIMMRTY